MIVLENWSTVSKRAALTRILTNRSMCSANLLYALNSEGGSLARSAGVWCSSRACESIPAEAMMDVPVVCEDEYGRGRNLLLAAASARVLPDLRMDLVTQANMDMPGNQERV